MHGPKLFVAAQPVSLTLQLHWLHFYAPQLCRQALPRRVLAMGILSVCLYVCLSVRLSRPGTDSMPGEIETAGLHHMIA